MTTADKVFTGNIPEIYEQYMVPMLFEPYARDLANRVVNLSPATLLEIAAGTGALTRAMIEHPGHDFDIVATDLNPPMLERGRENIGGHPRVSWQQADGMALPFDTARFDAVACQFGVMFLPDKVKGYSEVRRVLKPGGTFLFNAWDKVENNEFVAIVQSTLEALFPRDPPRFMERTPHGYWDAGQMEDELRAAGFENVSIEPVELVGRAASPHAAATGYCQGNPLRMEIETRAPGALHEVTAKVASSLREIHGDGEISGRISALVVSAS